MPACKDDDLHAAHYDRRTLEIRRHWASRLQEVLSIDEPLVSIGMPTYNGERYIRQALDSLLAQDYPNIEVLISDNASSDETPNIVREYTERDARLRVVHQPKNIGAPANFNFVFHNTSGPYFMWAADDDRWAATYVSACVRALASEPSAVLACSRIRFINEAGDAVTVDDRVQDNPDLRMASVAERVRRLLSRGAWYQIYGLMRRDALVRTRLAGNTYGADVVLSVELILQGSFVRIPEILFHYRLFAGWRTEPDRGGWHESIANRDWVKRAPYTYMQEAVAEAISLSDLPPLDRLRARLGMIRAVYIDRSPLRSWISTEAGTRLRMALRNRELRMAVKYAFLSVVFRSYRFAAWLWRRKLIIR